MADNSDRRRLLLLGDARQVHLSRWAEYFIENGYEVLTVTLEPVEDFPGRLERVHIPETIPDALRYPLAARRVRSLLHSFRPRVVNAHFIPNYGLIASMLGFEPWVLSTWGSDVMTDPHKSIFHNWRTRRVLSRALWVTSDARLMTDRLRSFGVDGDHILTFPLGVDTDRFHPREEEPPDGPRLISNRRLEPNYSVDTIIDAFTAVHDALPGAALTVANEGYLRSSLRQRAERSIASRETVFVGAVDHARMPTLLRENQIYVSMALSDTTSVSLLEAMACGLYPVVSDIPANREWITDGENGSLVPVQRPMLLARAIVDVWRNPDQRRRARVANLSTIEEAARWEDNMSGARELFERLCGVEES